MPAITATALFRKSSATSPKKSHFHNDHLQSADARPALSTVKPSCPLRESHVRFAPSPLPCDQKPYKEKRPKETEAAAPRCAVPGDRVHAGEMPEGCLSIAAADWTPLSEKPLQSSNPCPVRTL